jgi:hypothetical protein
MGTDRKDCQRPGRRAFRPGLDGVLEPRFLLSHGSASTTASQPLVPRIQSFTFDGGHGVRVEDSSAQFFDVHITGAGVVRAYPMSDGRVFLKFWGTAADSVISIDPVLRIGRHEKESAHKFSPPQTTQSSVLNVGGIDIVSGTVFQILGYRTADLSGPVTVGGTNPVDRIAFNNLLPGASIGTGGDLNTLDVYNNVNLDSGTGIYVGRDLNWLDVGGDVTLSNGASLFAARYIGLETQAAKGTDPGGVGGVIGGNLDITAPSALAAGLTIVNPISVHGNLIGNTQNQLINSAGRVIAFAPILAPTS